MSITNQLRDYKPTCKNEDLRTLLLGIALFQKLEGEPGLIETIIELVFEGDPLNPKRLKFLQLTEPLNFGSGGRAGSYNWSRFEPNYDCSSELKDKQRASWRGGPRLSLADFEQEMSLLQGKLQLCQMKRLSVEQDKDRHLEMDERITRRRIKDLGLLLSTLTALPEADQRVALSSSFRSPPVLFSFRLGEGPCLPLFARHFKSFQSKISGSCGDVQPILNQVFHVLEEVFPDHVMQYRDDEFYEATILQEPLAHFHPRFSVHLESSDFYRGMHVERREAGPMLLKVVFRFGRCCYCGNQARSVCSSCKVSQYCSRECQRNHWAEHKKHCTA